MSGFEPHIGRPKKSEHQIRLHRCLDIKHTFALVRISSRRSVKNAEPGIVHINAKICQFLCGGAGNQILPGDCVRVFKRMHYKCSGYLQASPFH